MTMLNAALAHARGGRSVFPCKDDNSPRTAHGFYDATTDEQQIGKWWRSWPNARIAMRTGREAGVFVLDVDMKNGKDGEAALEMLVAQHGALPETVEAFTPSGGRHIYFRMPEGSAVPCSTDKIAKGLDIRGDGGYVILPPSGTNGHEYQWELSSDPEEMRAAEAAERAATAAASFGIETTMPPAEGAGPA